MRLGKLKLRKTTKYMRIQDIFKAKQWLPIKSSWYNWKKHREYSGSSWQKIITKNKINVLIIKMIKLRF